MQSHEHKTTLEKIERPKWLEKLITASFAYAQKKPEYLHTGKEQYDFSMQGLALTTNQLFDAFLATKNSDKITILDIGSGNNLLVKKLNQNKQISAIGISAADYRPPSEQKSDETYILANAENLEEIPAAQNQDLIISSHTFMHFKDPANTLRMAYRALKPGGILIINYLFLENLKFWSQDLITYLQNQGYEIASIQSSSFANNEINTKYGLLIIAKTKEDLELPLEYFRYHTERFDYKIWQKITKTQLHYRPSASLKAFREQQRSEEKERPISDIDSKLIQLFRSEDYKKFSPNTQAKAIKDIVSQMNTTQIEANWKILEKIPDAIDDFNVTNDGRIRGMNKLSCFKHWSFKPAEALVQIKAYACLEIQLEKEISQFQQFIKRHFKLEIAIPESKRSPIMPGILVDTEFENQIQLFKAFYRAERAAESGIVKTDFLADKSELSPYALKQQILKYIKDHPQSRAAGIWELVLNHSDKMPISAIVLKIEKLAIARSWPSLFTQKTFARRECILNILQEEDVLKNLRT